MEDIKRSAWLAISIAGGLVLFGLFLYALGPMIFSGKDEVVRIGVTVYGYNNDFARKLMKHAYEHPDVVSGKVELLLYSADYNASIQEENVVDLILLEKVDGIIILPVDFEESVAAIEMANSNKIPVVVLNARVNSTDIVSYIGSNDVAVGYSSAIGVLERLDDGDKVVVLEGPAGQSAQLERSTGFDRAFGEYPEIEVLQTGIAHWKRNDAFFTMTEWLKMYGNGIDAVISQNDEMAIGALNAIISENYNEEAFIISGIDGVYEALKIAKENENFITTLQNAEAQAQGAIDIMMSELIKDHIPKAEIWEEIDFGGGDKPIYDIPWVPVNSENVDALISKSSRY